MQPSVLNDQLSSDMARTCHDIILLQNKEEHSVRMRQCKGARTAQRKKMVT